LAITPVVQNLGLLAFLLTDDRVAKAARSHAAVLDLGLFAPAQLPVGGTVDGLEHILA